MRETTNTTHVPIPAPLREITDTVEAVGLPVDVAEVDRLLSTGSATRADPRVERMRLHLANFVTGHPEGGIGRMHTRRHQLSAKTHTLVDQPKVSLIVEHLPSAVAATPGRVFVTIDTSLSPWQPLMKLSGDRALEVAVTSNDLYGHTADLLNAGGHTCTRTEAKLALFRAFLLGNRSFPLIADEEHAWRLEQAARALFPKAAN